MEALRGEGVKMEFVPTGESGATRPQQVHPSRPWKAFRSSLRNGAKSCIRSTKHMNHQRCRRRFTAVVLQLSHEVQAESEHSDMFARGGPTAKAANQGSEDGTAGLRFCIRKTRPKHLVIRRARCRIPERAEAITKPLISNCIDVVLFRAREQYCNAVNCKDLPSCFRRYKAV